MPYDTRDGIVDFVGYWSRRGESMPADSSERLQAVGRGRVVEEV